MTLLIEIVETSRAIGATAARGEKIGRLAEVLRRLEPAEAAIGVAYLSSQLRQRQIGVGYAAIRDLPEPAEKASLSLVEVDAALETIGQLAGPRFAGRTPSPLAAAVRLRDGRRAGLSRAAGAG